MSLWVRPTADRNPRFPPVPDTALSKQSEQVSGPTHRVQTGWARTRSQFN